MNLKGFGRKMWCPDFIVLSQHSPGRTKENHDKAVRLHVMRYKHFTHGLVLNHFPLMMKRKFSFPCVGMGK
jgi:hypothetical protein